MKISELSTLAGVNVATIKFYIREQLLPAGELVKPNQAEYDDSHVRRLRLVRALLEVGGVPIATARDVLSVVDSTESIFRALGVAQKSVSPVIDQTAISPASLKSVDAVLTGWAIEPHNPGRLAAAQVFSAFTEDDGSTGVSESWYAAYAKAARDVAVADMAEVDRRPDRASKVEMVIMGTVLGDVLFAAFRRAAGESVAAGAQQAQC
ncbi:MerR family transcriptional regulator [Cryobacterium adonitolivorans]|uniref:MerR family transcriptional regulator n=1 Tax=Cryobacterium adonitolivorans TaxID=1259189 RepID=UPI00141B04CA|nr:MerR family transcriptional regulator [Cryobacterium adonitolivorans]